MKTKESQVCAVFRQAFVNETLGSKMRNAISIVDTSSPEAIARAIKKVNGTPGLRIQPGIDALWTLYHAPDHKMLRSEIERNFGAFNLHFGWFCRRVAEMLGDNNPDELALVDYSTAIDGAQVLKLKAVVVAAMDGAGNSSKLSK